MRTKDYKDLAKQQERNIRRLRRQLHTYEALATKKYEAEASPTHTHQETVYIGRDTERQSVTKETVKRLWDQDQVSRTRVAELETQLLTANERNKVCTTCVAFCRNTPKSLCNILPSPKRNLICQL